MENLTTEEFCRKFGACAKGTAFAQNYKTMRECYAALLRGEAGALSASWATWASVDSAMRAAAWSVAAGVRAMTVAIRAAAWSVDATEYVASEGAAESEAQLRILAEFGNPFEEAGK